ncbi:MAG: hypothetical protein H3C58_11355, partial [Fimbriimonadaceae bacterium]|nr:hypothetical protein [Fimbriimonadaceae bacterium]
MSTELKLKPEESKGRAYVDRLLLDQLADLEAVVKLGEIAQRLSDRGIGLGAVRSLLASNPARFAYHERRWLPASRLESLGRPLAEAMRLVVGKYGGPLTLEKVVSELARTRPAAKNLEVEVRRIATYDPLFILLGDERLCLSEWAFLGRDLTIERAFKLNGVNSDDVEAVRKKLGDFDWRARDAIEKAVKTCAPVSIKALGAAAWLDLNPQDPRSTLVFDDEAFFSKALVIPGYVFVEGDLMPEKDAPKWIAAAMRVAEKLVAQIEVEDAAPIDVKDEDVERMVNLVKSSDKTVTGTRLLEDFYEITAANRTFPDDLSNLMEALTTRSDIWWVGGDRFRKPNSAPDFVFSVPEVFQFAPSSVMDEEGEPVDVELDDDGLSSTL